MAKTENIFVGKKLVGIRIKSLSPGSIPITDSSGALQVLTLSHSKGDSVKPHVHRRMKRVTMDLQECLVVLKGKIRIDLYSSAIRPVKRVIVKAGEVYIVLDGKIGVEYLEKSEVIEIKNGPFRNDTVYI